MWYIYHWTTGRLNYYDSEGALEYSRHFQPDDYDCIVGLGTGVYEEDLESARDLSIMIKETMYARDGE